MSVRVMERSGCIVMEGNCSLLCCTHEDEMHVLDVMEPSQTLREMPSRFAFHMYLT